MSAYVALATVKADLPSGYGSVLSDDDLNAYIADARGEVDELVGPRFSRQYETNTQKFPEIDDATYTTPQTIELCALWLTLARCFAELEKTSRFNDEEKEPLRAYYRRIAEEKLTAVNRGDIDLNVTVATRLEADDKYVDDETGYDRRFTNEEMDTYYP